MLFFSPVIVKIIDCLEGSEVKIALLLSSVPIILFPTCFVVVNPFANTTMLFCFYFSLGVMIRKYNLVDRPIQNLFEKILIIFVSVFSIQIILSLWGEKIHVVYKYRNWLVGNNSLFVLVVSVGIFILMLRRKSYYSKLINTIGSATFGVYLIHDNTFVRAFLWGNLFTAGFIENKGAVGAIILIVAIVILVYISCTVIECIRISIFKWLDIENRIYFAFINISQKMLELLTNSSC